ncbi:ragulator complex protein LAMTOR5 homolog [Ctenocephalides felis]|uniref:ragulator complex protein LAMTOR5 homolog n=1 Tax=Ctenocephalides felis TaxID=7515 RepID=UPI000E6E2351|nr:ragulator complex protein LAMTOR5 homolog [Ctenocephalides felis]
MEKALDEVMDDILSRPNVTGCLFADQQGLCLGSRGKVSPSTTGFVVALSDLSCKIQPMKKPPIIHLEADNRLKDL